MKIYKCFKTSLKMAEINFDYALSVSFSIWSQLNLISPKWDCSTNYPQQVRYLLFIVVPQTPTQ